MYRRRKTVLVVWIVALVGGFMLSGAIGGAFKTEFKLPGTESQAAYDLLENSQGFRDRQIQAQIVFQADQGIDDPEVEQAMEELFAEIPGEVDDVTVISPYSEEGARQVSEDGTIAYAEVNLADRSSEAFVEAGDEIVALGDDVDVEGLTVDYGGNMFAEEALNGRSEAIVCSRSHGQPSGARKARMISRSRSKRAPAVSAMTVMLPFEF